MNITLRLALSVALLVAFRASADAPLAHSRLHFTLAISANGEAGALWLAAVKRRHPEKLEQVTLVPKPLTDAERAWNDLIYTRLADWERETAALAANFAPVRGPAAVTILLGNRGGEDAFTPDERTIAFDVSRLHEEYGSASDEANHERIDRFFRHEYVHLLQKGWLSEHPFTTPTVLHEAILGIWSEGIGNYYSLSSRWRSTDGKPSAVAERALQVLTPRLLARLAALACGARTDSETLMATLSSGRFDEKWGALPAALWLDMEEQASGGAVKALVNAGPEGVWDLAERHLSAELRDVLHEVRAAGRLCGLGRQ